MIEAILYLLGQEQKAAKQPETPENARDSTELAGAPDAEAPIEIDSQWRESEMGTISPTAPITFEMQELAAA